MRGRRRVRAIVQRRHLLMLLALAGVWGASFMFIKIGDRELDPLLLVGIRMTLGALTLVGFRMALGALTLVPIVAATVGVRRALRELRAAAGPLVAIGLVNSAIPIYSISWAETRIDSGLTAILQASAPLFTALLAIRFDRDERVRGGRLVGLLVGFAGVALLVGAQPRGHLSAALAVVFSALCYASAALYTARRVREVSPLVTALGTLTAATVVTLPIGLFQLPDDVTGWKVTASVLTLGIAELTSPITTSGPAAARSSRSARRVPTVTATIGTRVSAPSAVTSGETSRTRRAYSAAAA